MSWLISGGFSKRLHPLSHLYSKAERVLVPEHRKWGTGNVQVAVAAWWHLEPHNLAVAFPSFSHPLCLTWSFTHVANRSLETHQIHWTPFFLPSLEILFCSVPLLPFSWERGPRWNISDLTLTVSQAHRYSGLAAQPGRCLSTWQRARTIGTRCSPGWGWSYG